VVGGVVEEERMRSPLGRAEGDVGGQLRVFHF
jgi:hypothetical protein